MFARARRQLRSRRLLTQLAGVLALGLSTIGPARAGDPTPPPPTTPGPVVSLSIPGPTLAAGTTALPSTPGTGPVSDRAASAVFALLAAGAALWAFTLRRQLRTERRNLERALQDRLAVERHHRELTEGAPDAIFTIDAAGHVLSANPAGTQLVGFTEEELRRMSVLEVLPPEERARTAARLASRIQTGGQSQPFVVEIQHRNGARRTVEIISRVLRSPDGTTRLEGVARDITDRQRGENALKGLAALTAQDGDAPFFGSVTRHLAELLGVDHAFIAVPEPTPGQPLRILAQTCLQGPPLPDRLPGADSAVAGVLGRQEAVHPRGARTRFPQDELLGALAAEAFIGIPLSAERHRPLGVLAIVHPRELDPTPAQLDMLRILAARVGAELDRVHTTAALRTSEERFRQLAEQGEDVLWVFDLPDRRLSYLAPAFARVTGVAVDACLARPKRVLRLMHREDRRHWLRALAAALHSPSGRYSTEFRIVRPNQATRWILDQGVVIRGASGQPVRVSGVARDITARKESELAVAGERARFRDLFENSPDAVFVDSFEGVILDVNRAACDLHRLPRERLIGRQVIELVPEEFRAEARRNFQRLVAGETSFANGLLLRSDGTHVPVELQATRLLHDQRSALLIQARDTSARRAAEEFLSGQKRILEWIATAKPLGEVLNELARVTEARAPGTLCWTQWFSVPAPTVPDVAAPSLDPSITRALAGMVQTGTPLRARLEAAEGQPVVVFDPFELALSQMASDASPPPDLHHRELLALPVVAADGHLLGVFGALLPAGHSTTATDLGLHRLGASLARVAIERHHTDTALQQSATRLRLANGALLTLARSEAISRGDLSVALADLAEAAARSVGVDRAGVWLLDESAGVLRRFHEFSTTEGGSREASEYPVSSLPRYLEAITHERLVSVTDVATDPRLSEFLRLGRTSPAASSRMDAGIRLRGRIAGVVILEHVGPARSWKTEEALIAGSLADIVAMALQASERRCMEEALRQSEEAYRSVVSALAEGVMLINREGVFLAYNDSAATILGLANSELPLRRLSDSVWDVMRLDGSPIPADEFPANVTLRTGQPITDWVMGVRRPDGSTVWISINTRPFARADDGEVASVVVSFTDITRRHRAERALRQGHELLRAITEVQARFIADADPARNVERMLSSLVLMTESEGGGVAEVVQPDPGPPRLWTYSPPATDLRRGSDAALPPELEQLLVEVRSSSRSVNRSVPPDASGPAGNVRHWLGLPLRHDDEVTGVVALVRDSAPYPPGIVNRLEPLLVTCANLLRAIRTDRQRQQAEARIRQLNAELEQRVEQRTGDLRAMNQELAEFAYVVTHDLKAPLRGIHQLSEWLTQDHAANLDAGGLRLLALLRQRVLHLQRLIDGLLACARVGRSPEPVSRVATRELVRQVVAVLAPPLNIGFHIADDLPVVSGNPERLHQVFQNLLDNAVKYLDKPQGEVRVTARREAGAWEFTVKDNGPGIPKRYRDKVFQIFQRLHQTSDIPGTGLGLTLVKRIVETRGGRIWIESEEDRGTSLCFTWPDQARERPVT